MKQIDNVSNHKTMMFFQKKENICSKIFSFHENVTGHAFMNLFKVKIYSDFDLQLQPLKKISAMKRGLTKKICQ